jgi:OFA family oxalate/formate antiporter-like MFS transporter
MKVDNRRSAALIASCAAMFWIGTFVFGLPGVMAPYWQETFGVGRGAVSQMPLWVMLALGVFMYVSGKWQEKIGHGRMVAIGALIMGVSTMMLGRYQSIGWVYFWAFSMGVASTFLYIPSLTVVQRWYPHRRGLVTGLVNLVFGLSASPMSPIFNKMLASMGPVTMTAVVGVLALITGLAVAPFMRVPEEQLAASSGQTAMSAAPGRSLTASEAVKTSNFWLMWFSWALAGGAGFAMVTLSTLFGLKMGLSMEQAVLILAAYGLMNGLSRIISGYLSDHIGRKITMASAFVLGGCAYILMPHVSGVLMWAIMAACVAFAFGTLFAVSAAMATDCFGLKHFGVIFGLIFTAYGFLAGPLGPWLGGKILDLTGGNFTIVFSYLGGFYLVAGALISFVRMQDEDVDDAALEQNPSLEKVYVSIDD